MSRHPKESHSWHPQERPLGHPKESHPGHEREPLIEGKIQHHGRFAFLLSGREGVEDLMLRGRSLSLAMDGDTVLARLTPGAQGRPVGEIVKVVRRSRDSVTGILTMKGTHWLATPEGADARDAIRVKGFCRGINPREGQVVVVKVTHWPTLSETAAGEAVEVLGLPEEAGVRLRAILRTLGLPEAFPDRVLAESRSFPAEVSPSMWEGRRDLRSLPVFTIDGTDAKDFDDAVSIEVLDPRTMRLGVHIADVSHYVRKGTALDHEAAQRATSVYLADRVVPMLPPVLSEKLCSLMPGVERLTLSAFMDVDDHGRVLASSLAETVIRSWRRFTYEEVEAILHGQTVSDVDPRVLEALLRMGKLYKTLNRLRAKRGALDMSMPEFKMRVDHRGRPLEVVKRSRLGSHRLIEEFMLLANETVASRLLDKHLPFLSRIHPDPDPRKLVALGSELRKMGITPPGGLTGNPSMALQTVLAKAAGQPLEETVNMLVMRTLKLAAYSHLPAGHFGLASKAYCHFTSPIRRYPDLLVHRGVKDMLQGRPEETPAAALKGHADHCSERERVATDAERRSVDILRAELLQSKMGQIFSGVVTGSAAFGLFVTLDDSGASGLVRGASATLGSRVKVRLESVNEGKGELDLSLAGANTPTVSHARPARRGQAPSRPEHGPTRQRPAKKQGQKRESGRKPRSSGSQPKFYERFMKKKRHRR